MSDTILNIQNVAQKVTSEVKTNSKFGSQLKELISEYTQEELPDGRIKLTMIIDPKLKEKNNG